MIGQCKFTTSTTIAIITCTRKSRTSFISVPTEKKGRTIRRKDRITTKTTNSVTTSKQCIPLKRKLKVIHKSQSKTIHKTTLTKMRRKILPKWVSMSCWKPHIWLLPTLITNSQFRFTVNSGECTVSSKVTMDSQPSIIIRGMASLRLTHLKTSMLTSSPTTLTLDMLLATICTQHTTPPTKSGIVDMWISLWIDQTHSLC